MMDKEQTIEITVKEYDKLKRASAMLSALERGGVDNWEWYSDCLVEFFKDED